MELLGEVLEMVAPLGQEDRRTPLRDRMDDVVEDQAVPLFVGCQRPIDLLDASLLVPSRKVVSFTTSV